MAILIRPDLRTAGGETNDIMLDDQYVGTLTLVYREFDRISGSVQLEEESLDDMDKKHVLRVVQHYVQGLIDATQAEECDVIVTYSSYEDMISTSTWEDENEYEDVLGEDEFEFEFDSADDEYELDDSIEDEINRPCSFFELVTVGQSEQAIEYHIYDEDGYFIAEAFCEIHDDEVTSSVDWMFDPLDDEIEGVANLLVADFEDDEIDVFVIDMLFEGEIIETIELTNDVLFDSYEDDDVFDQTMNDDYVIELVRDDGDALTYEIYQRSYGILPIGTATVDLASQQITGFIDFRNTSDADDRLFIAKKLMDEIDKEKDCNHLGITMMHGNEVIEEVILESE